MICTLYASSLSLANYLWAYDHLAAWYEFMTRQVERANGARRFFFFSIFFRPTVRSLVNAVPS